MDNARVLDQLPSVVRLSMMSQLMDINGNLTGDARWNNRPLMGNEPIEYSVLLTPSKYDGVAIRPTEMEDAKAGSKNGGVSRQNDFIRSEKN